MRSGWVVAAVAAGCSGTCGGERAELLVTVAVADGRTANTVEEQVVAPVEAAIASVAGVAAVQSVSHASQAAVRIELDRGADAEAVRVDAIVRLQEVGLPEFAEGPSLVVLRPADRWIVPVPKEALDATAARLRGEGREVRVLGVGEPVTRVELDLARLTMVGSTPRQVEAALGQDFASVGALQAVVVGEVELRNVANVGRDARAESWLRVDDEVTTGLEVWVGAGQTLSEPGALNLSGAVEIRLEGPDLLATRDLVARAQEPLREHGTTVAWAGAPRARGEVAMGTIGLVFAIPRDAEARVAVEAAAATTEGTVVLTGESRRVWLAGNDRAVLSTVAAELVSALATEGSTRWVALPADGPARVSLVGVRDAVDVSEVERLVQGVPVGTVEGHRLELALDAGPDLENLPIPLGAGAVVPLSTLAEVRTVRPAMLFRYGSRSATYVDVGLGADEARILRLATGVADRAGVEVHLGSVSQ